MTLHAVVAFVAVFLQAASAGTMYFIARAPGWERVRLMAAIALTACLYSALDFWFYIHVDDLALRAVIVQANVVVAAVHAAMWMRFTFSGEHGAWQSMPRWSRLASAAAVVAASLGAVTNVMLDRARLIRVEVSWLGLDERTYPLSAIGNAIAVGVLALLGTSLVAHLRRMRRGDRGAVGIVIGLSLYALCLLEEALVASGILEFMYLGTPGYLFAVLPLTVQLLQRFTDDARRLSELSLQLSSEVEVRTVERDEARESLVEQQRLAALGRLAAGVGHEINNPLQYLLFHLEELRSTLGATSDASVRQSLDEAVDGARRIGGVVTSLRTYGVKSEPARRVRVHDAIHTALRIAAPQLRHHVTLETDLQQVPDVLGDEGRLVQILVNPLVNAAQVLRARTDGPPARILVAAKTDAQGRVELIIRDNGPGFDPAILPTLGEPYVTTRARDGGTGLGLFVTRGLVASYGGELALEQAPEAGAQVRIVLPAAPADATTSAADEISTRPVVVPSRVLIVDDEPALLAVMERALGRLGHAVQVASDGHQALALADDHPFDLIISDLMMPELSGVALAAALAERQPMLRRRLIIMTGGAVTAEDEQFLEREDVVVVSKPVSLAELNEAMTLVLRRAQG